MPKAVGKIAHSVWYWVVLFVALNASLAFNVTLKPVLTLIGVSFGIKTYLVLHELKHGDSF